MNMEGTQRAVWWVFLVVGVVATALFLVWAGREIMFPLRYWLWPISSLALSVWSVLRLRNTAGTRKVLWCIPLAMGVGGTILYFALIAEGFRQAQDWPWPVCAFLLSVFSAFALFKLFRQEPVSGPGRWQLALVDLIGVAMFVGAVLSIMRLVNDDYYLLLPGLPLASVSGLIYVAGLLWSSRIGIEMARWRAVFSLGFAFLFVGSLAIGGVIAATIAIQILDGSFQLPLILEQILTGKYRVLAMMRWPLAGFPVGLVLFGISWYRMPRRSAENSQDANAETIPQSNSS